MFSGIRIVLRGFVDLFRTQLPFQTEMAKRFPWGFCHISLHVIERYVVACDHPPETCLIDIFPDLADEHGIVERPDNTCFNSRALEYTGSEYLIDRAGKYLPCPFLGLCFVITQFLIPVLLHGCRVEPPCQREPWSPGKRRNIGHGMNMPDGEYRQAVELGCP